MSEAEALRVCTTKIDGCDSQGRAANIGHQHGLSRSWNVDRRAKRQRRRSQAKDWTTIGDSQCDGRGCGVVIGGVGWVEEDRQRLGPTG